MMTKDLSRFLKTFERHGQLMTSYTKWRYQYSRRVEGWWCNMDSLGLCWTPTTTKKSRCDIPPLSYINKSLVPSRLKIPFTNHVVCDSFCCCDALLYYYHEWCYAASLWSSRCHHRDQGHDDTSDEQYQDSLSYHYIIIIISTNGITTITKQDGHSMSYHGISKTICTWNIIYIYIYYIYMHFMYTNQNLMFLLI